MVKGSPAMIALENISKHYHTKSGLVTALDHINLRIKRGEIFGVIGKSGAGKSSLLRCVNLLERPSEGTVRVNHREMTKLPAGELRQARHEIGMIFQGFNLLNTRTAYQNVAFPLELLGLRKKQIQARVQP